MWTDGQTDRQTNATNSYQQKLLKAISDRVCHVTSHALKYGYHAWKKWQDPSCEMSRSGVDTAARAVKQSNGNTERRFFFNFFQRVV
jgi:hypothetical protein